MSTSSAERAARRIVEELIVGGIAKPSFAARAAAIIREECAQVRRICGNCGLPLEEGETEEMCREIDAMSERLRKARSSGAPKGEGK